ncbi:MAG: hypothetical protein N3B21_05495 [Clostridia bacterium]|nr:hypothetical protein [Clostridia bacterium]
MKCNYDMSFIQSYNDGSISLESKFKFEEHLKHCSKCNRIMNGDRDFVEFIKTDVWVGTIPVSKIISGIDVEKYKTGSKKYRFAAVLNNLLISYKVGMMVGVCIIAVLVVLLSPLRIGSLSDNIGSSLVDKDTIIYTPMPQELTKLKYPWETVYADKDKFFFKSRASLIGYKNGHIYEVANFKELNANFVQELGGTSIKFNSGGSYAVIGCISHREDYNSNIYMMNTENGIYFSIAKGNFANVTDSWSEDGTYYALASKYGQSNIQIYDTSQNKLYEVRFSYGAVENLFVSNNGDLAVYSGKKVYVIKKDGEVDSIIPFEHTDIYYISLENKYIYFLNNGALSKQNLVKGGIVKHIQDVSTNAAADHIVAMKNQYNNLDRDGMPSPIQDVSTGFEVYQVQFMKNRFLMTRYGRNKVGLLDLKTDTFRVFNTEYLPEGESLPRADISPQGDKILFSFSQSILLLDTKGEILIDQRNDMPYQAFYPLWMGESKIVFTSVTIPGNNIANGEEFNVTSYDIESKKVQMMYSSKDGQK